MVTGVIAAVGRSGTCGLRIELERETIGGVFVAALG